MRYTAASCDKTHIKDDSQISLLNPIETTSLYLRIVDAYAIMREDRNVI